MVSTVRRFLNLLIYLHPSRLISASVGTVVYYGFQNCHPDVGNAFLVCCLMTGIAGNAFPFFEWFDQAEYKVILFFLI